MSHSELPDSGTLSPEPEKIRAIKEEMYSLTNLTLLGHVKR